MKFRPLRDSVVVRRIEGEDKTKGAIIIPDTVKEKPQARTPGPPPCGPEGTAPGAGQCECGDAARCRGDM
jgi:Chaperonin 10 Kd subunit